MQQGCTPWHRCAAHTCTYTVGTSATTPSAILMTSHSPPWSTPIGTPNHCKITAAKPGSHVPLTCHTMIDHAAKFESRSLRTHRVTSRKPPRPHLTQRRERRSQPSTLRKRCRPKATKHATICQQHSTARLTSPTWPTTAYHVSTHRQPWEPLSPNFSL